jgi:hypothetical protein
MAMVERRERTVVTEMKEGGSDDMVARRWYVACVCCLSSVERGSLSGRGCTCTVLAMVDPESRELRIYLSPRSVIAPDSSCNNRGAPR